MNVIKVETKFSPVEIIQDTTHEMDDVRTRIWRQVIQLQEDGVREALIKLGWTPPEEIVVQHLPADDTEGGEA